MNSQEGVGQVIERHVYTLRTTLRPHPFRSSLWLCAGEASAMQPAKPQPLHSMDQIQVGPHKNPLVRTLDSELTTCRPDFRSESKHPITEEQRDLQGGPSAMVHRRLNRLDPKSCLISSSRSPSRLENACRHRNPLWVMPWLARQDVHNKRDLSGP